MEPGTLPIQRHVLVGASLAFEAVQPLEAKMSKEEDVLKSAVPAEQAELCKNATTAFFTHSDALKAAYAVYRMEIWERRERHGM